MKKLLAVLCLCFVIVLAGCDQPWKETEPPSYTVRFVMKGNVCSEQVISQGQLPETVTAQVPGLRFVRWIDEQGQSVDPFSIPVTEDLHYEAQAYPELTNHVPYLFTDSDGYLRPDDTLTADELLQALEALAAEGAEGYFPGMPVGTQAVKYGTLVNVLKGFFDADRVLEAFPGEEDAEVTRTAFAGGMQQLLGREDSENISLEEDTEIPMDVTCDRTDTAALLEASMAHTPDGAGITWSDLELPTRYEPGFVNIDGWLYYVEDDYRFLRDGYVGVLYFGADGRYTCGDAELDQLVAQILKELIAEAPEADRMTVLRSAFDYCHKNFVYLRKNAYAFGQTGWEINDAKVMFTGGRGNCYNFAAIFWALARGLGYEARAVSGTCTKTDQPHGWVIIEIDGEDYFFDPEWQYAYTEREVFDKDMFMIPMSKIWYWTYRWTE